MRQTLDNIKDQIACAQIRVGIVALLFPIIIYDNHVKPITL